MKLLKWLKLFSYLANFYTDSRKFKWPEKNSGRGQPSLINLLYVILEKLYAIPFIFILGWGTLLKLFLHSYYSSLQKLKCLRWFETYAIFYVISFWIFYYKIYRYFSTCKILLSILFWRSHYLLFQTFAKLKWRMTIDL